MKDVSLLQVRRSIGSTVFESAYYTLFDDSDKNQSDQSIVMLLRNAVYFLNYGDVFIRRLGYSIIVRYSNKFLDYKPLYDVAINSGFIPIAKFIESKYLNLGEPDKFFNLFLTAIKENYRQQNVYLSYGQKVLSTFAAENKDNFVLVAPTSYGKSEILISKVVANKGLKTCIIVPTKALLAQTKKRLLNNNEVRLHFKRIITHPEMYKPGEKEFVAVLTQERLLRLIQKYPDFSIDYFLLDEAHNLMKKDNRAILLGQVILILRKRNANIKFNFFTPFISDADSLQIPHSDYTLTKKSTSEQLKIERFYLWESKTNRKLRQYDQFLNTFQDINTTIYKNEIAVIKERKAAKNIVYLNKQKHIEEFALKLVQSFSKDQTDIVSKAVNDISDFLHKDYNLLTCIKNGIVYHHGGMPEIVRLFVESTFSKNRSLQFIVTSSTLLEGVNIPAEKLFILTTRIGLNTFSNSQFKNLIGRVCRFSEVFDPENGTLRMLEPEIYILNGEYAASNANGENFLKTKAVANVKLKDNVENILLQDIDKMSNEEKKEAAKALEFLENIEPNTVAFNGVTYAVTEIGRLCYKNNVYDFDILGNEAKLNSNLEIYDGKIISDVTQLMSAIKEIFIDHVVFHKNSIEEQFGRLQQPAALRFYSMVFSWRVEGTSYKQLIAKFLTYWRSLSVPVVYAGSWGEIPFNDKSIRNLYVDLNTKSEVQKVNLAIIRIKEEQDFVDNNLIKYVEILNDLELIDQEFYEKIKYGSSDRRQIFLLKNGFSIELAKTVLKDEYESFVNINIRSDILEISPNIVEAMRSNNENEIIIFEVGYHLN